MPNTIEMKQITIIILILLTNLAFSQKSLFYDVPKKIIIQDSALKKIETYTLNENSDSSLIQQDYYENGLLDKIIMYKSDSVQYKLDYNYKTNNIVERIRCCIINNNDTTTRIMYFKSDKNGNYYYATDFDSTNNRLIIRQFIHYEYDLNGNKTFEHEFFFRDFSGYTTEGGITKYEYDEKKRLKYILSPDYMDNELKFKRIREYEYNENDNLRLIKLLDEEKPSGSWVEYKYDKKNRLIERMDFHDMTEIANFFVVGSTWQKNTVYYIYDDSDKLIMVKEIMQQEFFIREKHKIYYY